MVYNNRLIWININITLGYIQHNPERTEQNEQCRHSKYNWCQSVWADILLFGAGTRIGKRDVRMGKEDFRFRNSHNWRRGGPPQNRAAEGSLRPGARVWRLLGGERGRWRRAPIDADPAPHVTRRADRRHVKKGQPQIEGESRDGMSLLSWTCPLSSSSEPLRHIGRPLTVPLRHTSSE